MPNLLNQLKDTLLKGTEANYKDKIFRYKLRNIYRVVLCLIIILALYTLVRLQIENRVYTEVVVTEESERVGTQTSKYVHYDGKLLAYSKDGISA